MNPDIKVLFPIWTVSFLTQKSCMSVFGVRRLFFTAILWKRTTHSVFAQWLARLQLQIKGLFGEDFDYRKVHDKRIELMDKFISETALNQSPVLLNFSAF